MKTQTINNNGKLHTITTERNTFIQIDTVFSAESGYKDKASTSVKFAIGDTAEYDSYNLSYLGKIVGITEKTVSIQPQYENSKRVLRMNEFLWRNYQFNLEKTIAENIETSYTL